MKELEEIYKDCLQQIKVTEKAFNRISVLRVFFFILFLVEIVRGFAGPFYDEVAIGFVSLIILISLLSKSMELSKKKHFLENKIKVSLEIFDQGKNNQNDWQISAEANHPYAADLDIFGKNSLFTRINRCQTQSGKELLEQKLKNPLFVDQEIQFRQNAIKEMATKTLWSVNFLALTKDLDLKIFNTENVSKLFSNFKQPQFETKLIKFLLIFIPVFNVVLIASIFLLNVNGWFLLIPLLLSNFIIRYYSKTVNRTYSFVNVKASELTASVSVFALIEDELFSSEELMSNQQKVVSLQKVKTSELIKRLSKLIDLFENKNIMIFGQIVNLIFLWEIQYAYKIFKYLEENSAKIPQWFQAVGEFEALICFGLFASRNNDFHYPNCSEQFKSIEIINLAHPFLEKENRICNDFYIRRENNVSIITGANMTGKSTFLRAIGINLVLGMNGCPVCAEVFNFYPISIFTSMRTSDSLNDGSSYFNAEIRRLKLLIDKLENDEPQFIILDEILKGTNSLDKLKGSELFLQKLIKNPTLMNCVIATHDIELTKMENSHGTILNYCFELYNNKGALEANYKLSKGVTKSMNALALMKQFKIID